jgi:hypothetical protein
MIILESSVSIRDALKIIKPIKIAVAYIGIDYQNFIDPYDLHSIILSPTLGSNPNAIDDLVSKIGWNKVYLLDNLHSKIYLGEKSAIITSANLSKNGLDIEGLLEIGILLEDFNSLNKLNQIYEDFFDSSLDAYPDQESKVHIPVQTCHSFRSKPAGHSGLNLPPIPAENCH